MERLRTLLQVLSALALWSPARYRSHTQPCSLLAQHLDPAYHMYAAIAHQHKTSHTCSCRFFSVIQGADAGTIPAAGTAAGRAFPPVLGRLGGRAAFGRAGSSGSLSGLCPASESNKPSGTCPIQHVLGQHTLLFSLAVIPSSCCGARRTSAGTRPPTGYRAAARHAAAAASRHYRSGCSSSARACPSR